MRLWQTVYIVEELQEKNTISFKKHYSLWHSQDCRATTVFYTKHSFCAYKSRQTRIRITTKWSISSLTSYYSEFMLLSAVTKSKYGLSHDSVHIKSDIFNSLSVWRKKKRCNHVINNKKNIIKIKLPPEITASLYLRALDILGRFFTISAKGDNFCDFLFALLHANSLLKRDLLYKERICSLREQILSL